MTTIVFSFFFPCFKCCFFWSNYYTDELVCIFALLQLRVCLVNEFV